MAEQEVNLKKIIPIGVIILAIILLIVFWSRMTVTIESGHGGVLFRTFGDGIDTTKTYSEGFHFLAPWNKMHVFETRQQEISETMNVLSSNGLEIKVDISSWYQPKYFELGHLLRYIGTDYVNRVVIPALRSSVRSVIGRYTPEQLYSSKRNDIQKEIYEGTAQMLDEKHIQLNKILIRSIILPPMIKNAIENKLQQEQQSLEYEFKLEKASKEAKRVEIEAKGKARANEILNASLSRNILRDKGIEATLKLANSQNAKVVIVGGGEDGLPLILGDTK
ncbi:MAG: prohibitin family protein [Bacteroidales bacterium]